MNARPAVRSVRWRDAAACRDVVPELGFDPFFPVDGAPNETADWSAARALCRECPVVAECLDDALATETSPHHGFRGGETPGARRRMLHERRAGKRAAA